MSFMNYWEGGLRLTGILHQG
jgi:hypothetical protein